MKEIDKLQPRAFTRFCMSIGAVPSSYISALTIEEQILWFCSYLEKEVIPAVNNNAEAVTELQNLYVELKDYVDNYFDNLDLQEEVDNKLEAMAQSGELAELISQYLEAQAIIGFNTCSSLAGAENLASGSFAKTMGRNTYLDGYGAFYRIRERLNSDDPDGYHLIVLTETDNLVAEMIPDATISSIQSDISTIQGQIANINRELSKKYIFIGDSYNTTDTPQGGVPIVPWSTDLVSYLGLTSSDYYNSGVSGAGWVTGNTFLNQLQTLAGSMTSDEKNAISDIVVLGGVNDAVDADIYTAITSFANYVDENFPNAMITIGCISWSKYKGVRGNIISKLQQYNNMSLRKNVRVLENIFTAYHNYLHYQPDGHPNSAGSQVIAYYVANALKGGQNCVKWNKSGDISSASNTLGITADTIGTYKECFNGTFENIKLEFPNTITTNVNIATDSSTYILGTIGIESGYFPDLYDLGSVNGWLYHGTTMTPFSGRLRIYQDGSIRIGFEGNGSTISGVTLIHIVPNCYYNIPAEDC